MQLRLALCITGYLRTFHYQDVHQNILDFALNLTNNTDIFAVVSSGYGDSLKGMQNSPVTPLYVKKRIPNWFEFSGHVNNKLQICFSIIKQKELYDEFVYNWIITIRPDVVYRNIPNLWLQLSLIHI